MSRNLNLLQWQIYLLEEGRPFCDSLSCRDKCKSGVFLHLLCILGTFGVCASPHMSRSSPAYFRMHENTVTSISSPFIGHLYGPIGCYFFCFYLNIGCCLKTVGWGDRTGAFTKLLCFVSTRMLVLKVTLGVVEVRDCMVI